MRNNLAVLILVLTSFVTGILVGIDGGKSWVAKDCVRLEGFYFSNKTYNCSLKKEEK